MKSSSTYYRQAKQSQVRTARAERLTEEIAQEGNFTAEDRKVAEQQEAAELFAEFLANEI